MECEVIRESTSRNQANGSTPHRLQEPMKLRNTAAVLPPPSLPKKVQLLRLCARVHNRKNWIHIETAPAGPRVAAILSVMESCRRLDLPVREYLGAVLPGLASRTLPQLAELTPAAWAARQR